MAGEVDLVDDGPEVVDELVFTTKAKDRPQESERIRLVIDGVAYYAVKHKKTPEILAQLSRAAARQAKLPDQIWAVMEFLDQVVEEESAVRLRARYDDPADDFGLEDLFDIMEKLAKKLSPAGQASKGPAPARRRRR
ncbi:hypothetical protein [Nonomuraea salmonea]